MILAREVVPTKQEISPAHGLEAYKPDSLDWSWERSDDGGKSWKVLWRIHYERKK